MNLDYDDRAAGRRAIAEFQQRFGEAPQVVVRVPGRVQLFGEHTQQDAGFVLPLALDRSLWIAARRRTDQQVYCYSVDYSQLGSYGLDEVCVTGPLAKVGSEQNPANSWVDLLRSVSQFAWKSGRMLCGWDGVIHADLPRGAGLGSSTALCLGGLRVFANLAGWRWYAPDMSEIVEQAESALGRYCPTIDPTILGCARSGHAMLYDSRSKERTHVRLPVGLGIVLLDSGLRPAELLESIADRYRVCRRARISFDVSALRDLSLGEVEKNRVGMDALARSCARHVVAENERAILATEFMARNNAHELGCLMNASHRSMRDDFKVGDPAVESLVRIAQNHKRCHGARPTGSGGGGCALALVPRENVAEFVKDVLSAYQKETGRHGQAYPTRARGGAHPLTAEQLTDFGGVTES